MLEGDVLKLYTSHLLTYPSGLAFEPSGYQRSAGNLEPGKIATMPPHPCLPRLAENGCGARGIDTNARGALGIRTQLTKIH